MKLSVLRQSTATSGAPASHRDRAIVAAAALLVPALILVQELASERSGIAALLNYVPQQCFGLAPLLGLIYAQRRGLKAGIAANLTALAAYVWVLLGLVPGFGVRVVPEQSTRHVRLMTYNTHMGAAGGAALAATLLSQHPDIICLQETISESEDPRRNCVVGIQAAFPGWYCARAAEVTTLSRFPIISRQRWIMPRPGNRITLETRLLTPGGPLTVINTHIATSPTESRIDAHAPWPDRMVRLVAHTGRASLVRRSQLPVLDAVEESAISPWVMVGDFNNPPRGPFYRHLALHATDAFREAGQGFGYTFPVRLPVIRIDYCWLGPGMAAYRAYVPHTNTSDHLPLVTDLELPSKNNE